MTDYALLAKTLRAVISDDDDTISVLANSAALLNDILNDINWVGFYLLKGNTLTLGPFQGKVACTRIPVGKGVCGSAVAQRRVLRVANVHDFAGHIACDSASQSEIVLPIMVNGKIIAVLDIDSPVLNRFTDVDEHGLNEIASLLGAHLSHIHGIK
ncbi:GAF domain-containing protein [Pasteurellaceae bacterium HPA106]|uniref:GAF domain-containing protein n=1 Tax=Spirabiliibacterium pneumoniae TaxID=221400 RepID=UPI001AACA130|nr:GAF domain-containing protein [Spirabiliibacterium pneumoniae]MBE2896345.1 GAF domain-containing protein [Spirabiliibacterium pneumoniae]